MGGSTHHNHNTRHGVQFTTGFPSIVSTINQGISSPERISNRNYMLSMCRILPFLEGNNGPCDFNYVDNYLLHFFMLQNAAIAI
jgi:hypothetical protein